MFSVHGSSGSNWIVLRTLALERSDALVLVARNIHHSVINALKAFGLDFRFLPTPYEPRFEARAAARAPTRCSTRSRAIPRRSPSSTRARPTRAWRPTRARSSRAVHAASDHAMVIVDEAWGGHLRFHPELPESAMGAGADICVQSTHKLAGGLQQTGLIHWRDRPRRLRADGGGLPRVRHDLASYHLLASADAAVRTLAARGEDELGRAIERTRELKAALRARAARPRPPRRPRVAREPRRPRRPAATSSRRRSASAATTSAATTWPRRSSSAGSSSRRPGVHTITLITTFQLGPDAVAETVDGAGRHPRPATACPATRASRCRPTPSARSTTARSSTPTTARRYAKSIGHEVPLREAIGKVAAEEVEVYPPGIPLILEGFRVSADAVEYLIEARDKGGSIVARDTSLATLRVL